ncbi:sensor histidine kinase [Bdellovibrio reynosensis]|uniref:histidine kinase n=1 Tax=Bdellovibrio reynosensis TaxID=2835041 RepID=A0ABY4C6I1_9BACT|nr:ATP-binding protein [Bdellovibrio reynosensis]UOF00578.1 ATP-binding protein [Bdellovibrio reynosensis]
MEPTSPERDTFGKSTAVNKKAADVLRTNREKIRAEWEKNVRSVLVSQAKDKSSAEMSNTLQLFLNEVIQKIERNDNPEHADIYKGMSGEHGGLRATFRGYFLPDLFKEFSILRQIINKELHDHKVLSYEVRSIIDESIDSVISSAATEFASVQKQGIQDALFDAEVSNRDLDQFASVAAHDLKSPLATIAGYLELLKDELKEPPESDSIKYIETMQKASARMMRLIDSLLNYSRLSTPVKEFKSVDINEILKSTEQNLKKIVQETGATIDYENLPLVLGDEDFINQLFQNLISNSIKFRRAEPPKIIITAEDDGGMWKFILQDNGIGFDPTYKTEIFKLYKKLHGNDTYQGSGIGLATCRKVVELHGGKIWADSSPGKGTIFYFTLPKGPKN